MNPRNCNNGCGLLLRALARVIALAPVRDSNVYSPTNRTVTFAAVKPAPLFEVVYCPKCGSVELSSGD